MHEVFSMADPLKLMELIFSTEYFQKHTLSNLLKLTEINELYFSGNRIRPLWLAFTELLCLK